MRQIARQLILIAALIATAGCSHIFPPQGPIQLNESTPMFRPGPQMEYCVDESGTKTLEEI
ncbi:MAG TPA: hypothetical protein PLB73_10605, partial [Leptospiraceae bacterium]|nr:hypothetical protein [Leptospiraceae bacterium]